MVRPHRQPVRQERTTQILGKRPARPLLLESTFHLLVRNHKPPAPSGLTQPMPRVRPAHHVHPAPKAKVHTNAKPVRIGRSLRKPVNKNHHRTISREQQGLKFPIPAASLDYIKKPPSVCNRRAAFLMFADSLRYFHI